MDLSANCSVIIVGVTSPISSLSNIVRGIIFILAPKSHNALSIATPSMLTGTAKLPRSFNLGVSFLCKIALHSSDNIIVSLSSLNLLLLDRISFINLAYAGICSKASEKGILTSNFLKISRNFENCFSKFFFIKALGKGTLRLTIPLGGVLLSFSLAGSAALSLSTMTGLFIVLFSIVLPTFSAKVFPLLKVIEEQFSFGFTSVSEGNLPGGLSANCLAICPTSVSKFLIAAPWFMKLVWDSLTKLSTISSRLFFPGALVPSCSC